MKIIIYVLLLYRMFNQSELRRRPTYNELIQEISEDYKVVFPDRRAKFFRDSPYLSYLDNETYLEVEDQQKTITVSDNEENENNKHLLLCPLCRS